MKFEYSGLIIPSNVKPENISNVKKFSFLSNKRFDKSNRVNKMKQKIVDENIINSFALRNYWSFVLAERRIVQASWNTPRDIMKKLKKMDSVRNVSKKEGFTTTSIVIRSKEGNLKNLKSDIYSNFSNKLPIYNGYTHLEIMLSVKWLVGNPKFFFDDLEHLW